MSYLQNKERSIRYYYGQIRSTNYNALLSHYGKEPPWEMENSPHVDLVKAVLENRVSEKS